MPKLSVAAARKNFSDVVNQAAYGRKRIILTRRGKSFAAIVSISDLKALRKLEDQADAAIATRELAEFRASGEKGIPLSEIKKKLKISQPSKKG